MAENCIFCKIAGGHLPANILYEDDTFIAILDAFPATKGHTLIIPKAHAHNFFDLPEATAALLLPLAKKLAIKINTALKPDGLNIMQNNLPAAGQSVLHYHMHLIPRWERDGAILQKSVVKLTQDEMTEVFEELKQ